MISQCANPECSAHFIHYGEGKLFPFEIKNPSQPCKDIPNAVCMRKPHHHTIFFWLCQDCARRMNVHFDPRAGLSVTLAELTAPGAQDQSGQ